MNSIIKYDRYVKPVCAILNNIQGVQTFASCNGHGNASAYIAFDCDNINSLKYISKAVYDIRWNNEGKLNKRTHFWGIELFPQKDTKDMSISFGIIYEGSEIIENVYKYKINTKKAWSILKQSLKN